MTAVRRMVEAVKAAFGGGEPLREAAGVTVDADEDQWRKLSDDPKRDLSPLSQDRMQETALYLWDANLMANRIVELQLAFLLAESVDLRAKDETLQPVLDKFWRHPINQMDIKLPKKVRELSLFGEQCWPAFVNEISGQVRLGYLDPTMVATVVTDPDNIEQAIGIVTKKGRKGEARRFKVIVNGPDEELFTERTRKIRETFTDGECFWFTVNDLSSSRRGRSDLRAPADWVDAYDSYLFGELDRYNFLRAFIWDVTLTGATPQQVTQRSKEITTPRPGSVRVHNDTEAWKAETPDVKAADSAEGARLIRNHVLGGATIPEHWFGGGGDVNRAAAAEMGEPTFKVLSLRQRVLKHILESLGTYALRQYLIAVEGAEPEWDDERLVCEAVMPEMTAKDTTKYAAAFGQVVTAVKMAVDAGLLTEARAVELLAAVAGRLGVEFDPAQELKDAAEEKAKRKADDSFPPASDPGLPDPQADPAAADQAQ